MWLTPVLRYAIAQLISIHCRFSERHVEVNLKYISNWNDEHESVFDARKM